MELEYDSREDEGNLSYTLIKPAITHSARAEIGKKFLQFTGLPSDLRPAVWIDGKYHTVRLRIIPGIIEEANLTKSAAAVR
mmetsp:Transcript_32941/g.77249  ORF Transcript_32941/g.77249 Transcript_32941/m.77249 type:complete len:81 (+) Transcript_32941:414-656(+)